MAEESEPEVPENVEVPANEVLHVKFFGLSSTKCGCGEDIEVVRVAVTADSRPFLQAYCSQCASEEAAKLHEAGYHSDRGGGEVLFNGEYVPPPGRIGERD